MFPCFGTHNFEKTMPSLQELQQKLQDLLHNQIELENEMENSRQRQHFLCNHAIVDPCHHSCNIECEEICRQTKRLTSNLFSIVYRRLLQQIQHVRDEIAYLQVIEYSIKPNKL